MDYLFGAGDAGHPGGAGLIFSGITDIVTCFYLAKKAKGYFDDLNAVDSTFAEVVDGDGQKD